MTSTHNTASALRIAMIEGCKPLDDREACILHGWAYGLESVTTPYGETFTRAYLEAYVEQMALSAHRRLILAREAGA